MAAIPGNVGKHGARVGSQSNENAGTRHTYLQILDDPNPEIVTREGVLAENLPR